MTLRMGERGPWRGPSAPRVPCRSSDLSRTTAFLAQGAFCVLRDSFSSLQKLLMRRADPYAARTAGDGGELWSAYPQPLRAAAYERGRIDG
ncbi:hypothetical protein PCE31107_04374 [Pandoraea cepalis]|uniref:Uncharacterized protein n=1 Tax=Pandoraea cepalis TaxID=2508294 RepID=A0A5E4Y8S3_9BURK|nr:hypothetical protein PCE31107_04374 [Pandoraea cepalis]